MTKDKKVVKFADVGDEKPAKTPGKDTETPTTQPGI